MHAFVTTQTGFDLRGQSSQGASDVPDVCKSCDSHICHTWNICVVLTVILVCFYSPNTARRERFSVLRRRHNVKKKGTLPRLWFTS